MEEKQLARVVAIHEDEEQEERPFPSLLTDLSYAELAGDSLDSGDSMPESPDSRDNREEMWTDFGKSGTERCDGELAPEPEADGPRIAFDCCIVKEAALRRHSENWSHQLEVFRRNSQNWGQAAQNREVPPLWTDGQNEGSEEEEEEEEEGGNEYENWCPRTERLKALSARKNSTVSHQGYPMSGSQYQVHCSQLVYLPG